MIYHDTPVEEIHDAQVDAAGVRLLVKREDLNHPYISGNKWWKLKYNIDQASQHPAKAVLTFGGAFSNHIYATAAAANEHGLESTGIIRGEENLPLNPTLTFAERMGMKLHFISRDDYRRKHDASFVDDLRKRFGDFYLIPEGGTNSLAVQGCADLASSILSKIDYDYLVLPVGTGGTMAGMICGVEGQKDVIGVSVLKNGDFLKDDVSFLVKDFSGCVYGNWSLLTSYHHGGYAKTTKALLEFVSAMKVKHNLLLDHVYTGKMMFALFDKLIEGHFARGSTILALHTGGLQGIN